MSFISKKKQIDIYHYLIRERVKQNEIYINYINIKNILADDFIKALEKLEFENY